MDTVLNNLQITIKQINVIKLHTHKRTDNHKHIKTRSYKQSHNTRTSVLPSLQVTRRLRCVDKHGQSKPAEVLVGRPLR